MERQFEMTTIKEIISLKNVSLSYDDIEVFQDISLTLSQGDFYYLTGESGVGKTSLLRLIYMDNMNFNGKLKLFEQNIKILPRRDLPKLRRKVGVVSQEPNLLDHLTLLQNVMMPLLIAGFSELVARNRAHKVLNWIGLGEHVHVYPPMLSGGQKQTTVLARALVINPTILLADEPTGNLDLKNARRLMEIFEFLHKKGTTILMATHNHTLVKDFPHPELRLISKRLEFINHKPILAAETPAETQPEPIPAKAVNEAVIAPTSFSPPKIQRPETLRRIDAPSAKAPSKYSSFHRVSKP